MSEILVNQIEFSTQIVISKCDLINEDQFLEIQKIIKSLKINIPIFLLNRCDYNMMFDMKLYDKASIVNNQVWFDVIMNKNMSKEDSEFKNFGIQSFVWKSRTPLHPNRFLDFISSRFEYGKLIRSKGFFWLGTRLKDIGVWQSTGIVVTTRCGGTWWRYVAKEKWPSNKKMRDFIGGKWNPITGDCRQEIAFIGFNMDFESLERELNNCLLSPVELENIYKVQLS